MPATTLLEQLASAYDQLDTVSADTAEKILHTLDQASDKALQMLVARKVKFLWLPAKRRLIARGITND